MPPLLALAALLAAPAPAAPAAPAPSLAALTAQADAVIAAAQAQKHFTNDTRRGLPAARHTESGLRCMFEVSDGANRIVPIGAADGRGGGMACLSRPAGFSQTMEAMRLVPGQTLESVFAASVLNLTARQPAARPHEPGGMVVRLAPGIGSKAPPEPRTAGYLLSRPSGEVYSRVSVAVVGGWIIRQQFEAPAARAEEAELLAGVVMSTTLIDMADRAT
jgi:hypothetical protein